MYPHDFALYQANDTRPVAPVIKDATSTVKSAGLEHLHITWFLLEEYQPLVDIASAGTNQ
jgi:hypothetical protein